MTHQNWQGFIEGAWCSSIDVRDFIQTNYREYTGDESFLAGPTQRTSELMNKLNGLFALEQQREEFLTSTRRLFPLSRAMLRDTSTRIRRSSSVCRPTALSREESIRSAVSEWLVRRARLTAIS